MIEIQTLLDKYELKEFKDVVVEIGESLGLQNSIDKTKLDKMVEELNEVYFEEGDALNETTIDEETVKHWVKILKPKIEERAKKVEKQRKGQEADSHLKDQFIKLRAEGKSVKEITRKMKITLDQVKGWLDKDEDFYSNYTLGNNLELEDMQSKYLSSSAKRIGFIGETLNEMTKEIKERGFKDLPTDKLLEYSLKYMDVLKNEKTELNVSVTKEVGIDMSFRDTSKTQVYNL